MTEELTTRLFLRFSSLKLQQLSHRLCICLTRLSDEQIWARKSEGENSVGNLVLHLCGNVGEWILASIGGHQYTRRRDEEFAAPGGVNSEELSNQLASIVMQATGVIKTISAQRLSERLVIQTHDASVLEAIYHVVEHFSMHAGQIFFITKMLTGRALDFDHDLQGEIYGC